MLYCVCVFFRFRNEEEPVLAHDVVLPVDDNCQLSVDQYRQILYKVKQTDNFDMICLLSTLSAFCK